MRKTKDYERFKFLGLNRNLNRTHINNLKDSIAKNGYLMSNPIMVNENMEIIDGQHRFMALKERGDEIPYEVVNNGYDAIIDLNTTQRNWKIEDYINFYCEKDKNKHYLRLKRLTKELNTSASNILTMALGKRPGGVQFDAIKKGNLELTIDDELRIEKIYEKFMQVAKSLKLKPTSKLCGALIEISTRNKFRWTTMLEKCAKFPTLAYNCRTEDEFRNMLKDIYNYNQRKEENRI